MKPIVAVDAETKRIQSRAIVYPPKPVGIAVYGDGVPARYLSWGHPDENNSSPGEARKLLRGLWKTHRVVFHNSSFDCEVCEQHLGTVFLPDDYDDTLFLGFLIDPRARELDLKSMAEKHLGQPPDERDRLKEWILANIKGSTPSTWGEYISEAPMKLVAKYAIGDVKRTYKLYKVLSKQLTQMDKDHPIESGQHTMLAAYQRELKLMPVINKMERHGIPLDIKGLERDLPLWEKEQEKIDKWLVNRLGGRKVVDEFGTKGEPFNIASGAQLANALEKAGLVEKWVVTAKGNRSTSKVNLEQMITDRKFLEAMQKRTIYDTYIDTYARKWITESKDGRAYPRINQTRNAEGDKLAGTRTGRLSYSDSWHGVPNPERKPFPELPVMRNYVVPSAKGRVIAVRDYSQQEYRILGHYENGPLLARYQEDPTIDMHDEAKDMIHKLIGVLYDRRPVKDTGFGIIYGLGLSSLAFKLKLSLQETKDLRKAYLMAIPGLKELQDKIKKICGAGEPIRTWGGRLYWVEPPSYSKKFDKVMDYVYKMLNVLIQGGAADCTKEAMIRADSALSKDTMLLIQIHDELGIDTAKEKLEKEMKVLREAMESVEFDVKMLTDGKVSSKNWGSVKKYNDRR